MVTKHPDSYHPITLGNIADSPYWRLIPEDIRADLRVVGEVLPFRANDYVLSELIDWDRVPEDPVFRLLFLHRDMLEPRHYATVEQLLARGAGREEMARAVGAIRAALNPHPGGQMSHNVPALNGHTLHGIQHKYRETVLFFPSGGQSCHAYCTFCFRWPQFIGVPELKFQRWETSALVEYPKTTPGVTDVLFTGGDPLVMVASTLARYVEPLLAEDLAHLDTIRIGTKAVTYWPHRFVTDRDADDLLRLFERVVDSGKHLAIVAHINHPAELRTEAARRAIRRIRSTGAVIRVQAPLVRHINDDADVWAELWRQSVRLGMVPYYMFVERDTGPRNYFEVPLSRAVEIFRGAYRQVSGLARTARGPCMSSFAGKVIVDGVAELEGARHFLLHYLQARETDWVNRPFLALYDPRAAWFDQLRPARARDEHFFPHLSPARAEAAG